MQAVFGRVVLMALFLVGGAALWMTGQAEHRLVDGHKRLATLQYSAAEEATATAESSLRLVGALPMAGEAARADAREQRATSQYWLQQYGALEPEHDASGASGEHDPNMLFLAANAAYHSATLTAGADREATVRMLESVMKAYVDVLKNSPGHADAAYNYEFVAHKRTLLAQARTAGAKAGAAKPDAQATIQGRPGAPPKTEFTQFKIVTPKQKEERDDPDAGRGIEKVRKG